MRRRVVWLIASSVVLVVTAATTSGVAGGSTSTLGQNGRDVTVDAEVGIDGVVPAGAAVPVRVTVTSNRARSAVLRLEWDSGGRDLDLDLGANTATEVDVSIGSSPWLEISVVTPSGGSLAQRTESIDVDPERTLVGIGPSLASQGAPASSPTIGAIQTAALVGLTDEVWTRTGVLAAMSGIVLSGADLDTLSDDNQRALREWIWMGGDLAVDIEPRDQLPVVDLPAAGEATAVGAGWVRFTGGRAGAGEWSAVLEPATIHTGVGGAQFDNGFGFVDWEFLGLIRVGFLPTWVIALSVFGTALLAGPLMWFLLRDRRRRRWMWVAAPGISVLVAAALLVTGQGVFTSASSRVVSDVRSSAWSSTGTVLSGIKDTTVLDLPVGAELIGSTPDASVVDSGGGRTVRIDLPRNSFGSVGVGPVTLDEGPRIDVTATATGDGTAEVSVTNASTGTLTGVSVTGNGRTRQFADVQPGATETLPFEVAEGLPVFGPVYPFQQNGPSMQDFIGSVAQTGLPDSRGLILISGTVSAPVSAAGLAGDGIVAISSAVPITSEVPDDAAVRIDALGGLSFEQIQMAIDEEQFGGPGGGGFGGAGGVPTTVVGQGENEELPIGAPEYVRFVFPGGRSAGPCGMHTIATGLSIWNGSDWVPMERVGEPYETVRITGLDGESSEMQGWQFPAAVPGERLHLRIDGRALATPSALLFDCGPRP